MPRRASPLYLALAGGTCLTTLTALDVARAEGGFTLDDFAFLGIWDALTQNWEAQSSGCIWSDAGETTYRVRAEGLHDSATQFQLENQTGDRVRLRVYWNDRSANTGREELVPGQLSGTFPIDPDLDCGGTANVWITFSVSSIAMDLVPEGVYTDSLYLTLDPL